ncbi:TonB family protein [Shewanella profunda]|uniref:energy transducer TonB n=1 Tax=Shewanella profunda TaxID=254793 RepID=UPI00201037AE|nr:energy transducer TonB [Shewanella profunda]MCL1089596.1 TonB family protein [Shewanella profunda]
MTPKRYLVFGALTIAIQTGVIASQPSVVPQQLNAISTTSASILNRSANHVSLNLTMPLKTVHSEVATITKPKATKPEPTKHNATKSKTTEPIITEPKAEPTSTAKIEKSSIQSKSIDTPALKPSSTKTASQPKTVNQLTQAEPQLANFTLSKFSETKTTKIEEKESDTAMQTELTPHYPQTSSIKTNIVELEKPLFTTPPPQPNYPRMARKKGLEGTAMVEVMFNELGEQLALTLVKSSGFSLLDQAALEAVETWQFEAPPQKLASHYRVRVPIRFALN